MEHLSDGFLVSIGTTHPWNIAGIGLDARVAADYGMPHAMVIAAVSAQDRDGVRALETIPVGLLVEQLRALPQPVAAYRIGALISSANVRAVAEYLSARSDTAPVVVDPVLQATLGGALQSDAEMPVVLLAEIIAKDAIVTPNLAEAAQLTGMRVANESGMKACGKRLVDVGTRAALITGGHLEGDPIDVLVTGAGSQRYSGPRLPGSMRGSGCTLAASLACELARSGDLFVAAARAHAYVREKIAAARVRGGLQVAF